MGVAIAVGVPTPLAGRADGWDITPLVAAVAAILVWRFGLRREVTLAVGGAALLFGLLVATAADSWGLLPTLAVTVLIACAAMLRFPRRYPR